MFSPKKNSAFIKFFLCFFSILVTILFAIFLSETLFFDKFIYKKSTKFGYVKNQEYPLANRDNDHFIHTRTRDMIKLLDGTLSDEKAPKNIFIVGDSFAYGLGLPSTKTFPSILQKKLGKNYKIYNLSLNGDHIVDHYTKILMAMDQVKPDLIIIGLVSNDLYFHTKEKYPRSQEVFSQLSEECSRRVFYAPSNLLEQPWEIQTRLVHLPSVDPQYANICFLKKIVEKLESMNIEVVYFDLSGVNTSPSSSDKTTNEIYKYIIDMMVLTIEKSCGKVIRTANYPYFKWSTVSKREGHPSAETHEMYAKILLSEILNIK